MAAARTTIDPSDPLYLHPSDHPGLALVTSVLEGANYGEWKRLMRIALSAKNKFCFVNGSFQKPPSTDPTFPAWERVNDMVISWIFNAVNSDIRSSILYTESAKEIWEELGTRFGQKSRVQLYSIQKELSSIAQGSTPFASFFTKIKSYWDELKHIHRFPRCTCGAVIEILKYEEEQKLMQLLMALNDDYSIVRGSILMMNPLPSVDQAYRLLMHEEQHKNAKNSPNLSNMSSDLASFHVNYKKYQQTLADQSQPSQKQGKDSSPATGQKRSKFYCTNCKKTNHNIERCFFIHGFPPNYKGDKKFAAAQVDTLPTTSEPTSSVIPGLSSDQYS